MLDSLLANVPAKDFLPGLAQGRGSGKQARASAPEAVAALAGSLGAQEAGRVAPVQRTIAAFGPRCASS